MERITVGLIAMGTRDFQGLGSCGRASVTVIRFRAYTHQRW